MYMYMYITNDPATQSAFDQMANSQARWRDRSSAALWIRRARPCACAWRTESHTLTSYPILLPTNILILQESFLGVAPASPPPRPRSRTDRLLWILESQDASKTLPRGPVFSTIFLMPFGIDF